MNRFCSPAVVTDRFVLIHIWFYLTAGFRIWEAHRQHTSSGAIHLAFTEDLRVQKTIMHIL